MSTKRFPIRPRNDYVVVSLRKLGATIGGVALPDNSREGNEWRVVATGPEVEDLEKGDRVELMGEIGQDIAHVPGQKGCFVTKQANILLVYDREGE